MAVPKQNAFEGWLALAREMPAHKLGREVWAEFRKISPDSPPPAEFIVKVKERIDEGAALIENVVAQLQQLPLHRWLVKQPGYKRAEIQLWKGSPPQPERRERFYKHIDDRAQQARFPFGYVNRFFETSIAETWIGELVTALYEYHYTKNAEQMYSLVTQSKKIFSSFET